MGGLCFLVDAQLPEKLAGWLRDAGVPATHTLDLERGNRTPDSAVTREAEATGCVVVSKDGDFVDSHLLRGRPPRLLHVATGNLSNQALKSLIDESLPAILDAFRTCRFVELSREHVILRDSPAK